MTAQGAYPATRLRRTRRHAWSRALVSEQAITASDLIWPVFVQEGTNKRSAVESMPGVFRLSIDLLVKEAARANKLGIPAIALFPAVEPKLKTLKAEESYNPKNLVCRAVAAVKKAVPELGIICDVALDPYTTHGHDGIVKEGDVDNDATLAVLVKQAVAQAKAGCDIVAPSDMMDGRVGVIRAALDDADFNEVSILSYAAKYASAFYGPFREAVGSAQSFGKADKRTYQMDPSNAAEALREVALDIAEGADFVMVKPGLPYLDIIASVKQRFSIPVFAYQVSGEYAMLKATAEKNWLDYDKAMMESLLAMKRAGASAIFTYAALEVAAVLSKSSTAACT